MINIQRRSEPSHHRGTVSDTFIYYTIYIQTLKDNFPGQKINDDPSLVPSDKSEGGGAKKKKTFSTIQWSFLKSTRTLTLFKHTLHIMYTQSHDVYCCNYFSSPPITSLSRTRAVTFRIQTMGY